MLRSKIEVAVDCYSAAWVTDAIEIAVKKGTSGRNWRYLAIYRGDPPQMGLRRQRPAPAQHRQQVREDYTRRYSGHQEQAEPEPEPEPAEADPAAQQLWGQVVAELQGQVPQERLTGARALRVYEQSITVEVPSRKNQVVLERRHYQTIQQSLQRVTGSPLDICFVLDRAAQVT